MNSEHSPVFLSAANITFRAAEEGGPESGGGSIYAVGDAEFFPLRWRQGSSASRCSFHSSASVSPKI